MSVSKRRVIAGMGIVVVLLLFRVELESQVVSNWVDHWPTARGGVIAVMDTVCWDYDTLDNDPCDSTRLAVVGYIPDTNTVIDSCLWSSRMLPFGGNCSCGGLYPGGVDYAYDTWGWNYDPAHQFDTCGNHDQANPCGGPAQPRHLYDVRSEEHTFRERVYQGFSGPGGRPTHAPLRQAPNKCVRICGDNRPGIVMHGQIMAGLEKLRGDQGIFHAHGIVIADGQEGHINVIELADELHIRKQPGVPGMIQNFVVQIKE